MLLIENTVLSESIIVRELPDITVTQYPPYRLILNNYQVEKTSVGSGEMPIKRWSHFLDWRRGIVTSDRSAMIACTARVMG